MVTRNAHTMRIEPSRWCPTIYVQVEHAPRAGIKPATRNPLQHALETDSLEGPQNHLDVVWYP